MVRYFFLAITAVFAVTADGQPLFQLDSLKKKTQYFLENHPTEKVYVHFDKSFYALGEDCWYKAYVVRSSDLGHTDISSVLYLDWIDPSGKIVKHQRLKIVNGGATGDFRIDTTLDVGIYSVKAYTNWMRNTDPGLFFSKKIRVVKTTISQPGAQEVTVTPRIDLQFFPEGGTFVEGIKTRLAFKAIDQQGRGVEVKGKIVDDRNRMVTRFQSSHNGMGVLPFIGDSRKLFRAVLEDGQVHSLPVPSQTGITLAASNLKSDKISLEIQSTNTGDTVYLIGVSRGSIYYAQHFRLSNAVKNISISKNELPEGILQFTLFNREGVPVCERMLFIRKNDQTDVNITSDKEQYRPRDSVTLRVRIDGVKADSTSSFSVSITDADIAIHDNNAGNIYTQLLLQSDLKGNVEDPGWYFALPTMDRVYALDLVMLTHGWARYNWKKIQSTESDVVPFFAERGISLQGQIFAKNNPVANTPFTFLLSQTEDKYFDIFETDSLGQFFIYNLDFSDSASVSWRVMNGKKGAVQNAKVELTGKEDIPTVVHDPSPSVEPADELIEKISARYSSTGVWNLRDARMLEEVVVKAARIPVIASTRMGVVVKPTPAEVKARLATNQFVSRYAMKLPFYKSYINHEGEEIWPSVKISIDGNIIENTGPAANPYFLLNSVPIEQIEHVLVSGYGHKGYFIAIKTKDVSFQDDEKTITLKVKGYDYAREFYHPKYGPNDVPSMGADTRTTLYWNSNLQIDEDGTAVMKFYNSDLTQKFLITIEGISSGKTITVSKAIGQIE